MKELTQAQWDELAAGIASNAKTMATRDECYAALVERTNKEPGLLRKLGLEAITPAQAEIVWNLVLATLGDLVLESEKAVRLPDLGILCLKFVRSRQGIAPNTLRQGYEGDPKPYTSNPRIKVVLRRGAAAELDAFGQPIGAMAEGDEGDEGDAGDEGAEGAEA